MNRLDPRWGEGERRVNKEGHVFRLVYPLIKKPQ